MKFNIFMTDERIHQAAALVEKHYKDNDFLNRIRGVKSFNFTTDTGEVVASKILSSDLTMNIRPYKTKWPWSKAIGYAAGNTIYVNTRKLDLPLADRVNNFFHEPLHLIGYSHNSNNKASGDSLESVPYKCGKIFSEYVMSLGPQ